MDKYKDYSILRNEDSAPNGHPMLCRTTFRMLIAGRGAIGEINPRFMIIFPAHKFKAVPFTFLLSYRSIEVPSKTAKLCLSIERL